MQTLWRAWVYLMMGATALPGWPVFWLFCRYEKLWPWADRMRHWWAKLVLLLSGFWLKTANRRHLPKQPCIVAANHFSYIDIVALLAALPGSHSFMAKAELSRIPLLGNLFKTLDIAVERENGPAAARSLQQAKRRLAQGRNVIVFAEGGIFAPYGELKTFKPGVFRMAAEIGAPLLPVALPDTHRLFPCESRFAKPGLLRVILQEPLWPQQYPPGHWQALRDEAHRQIEKALNDAD